MGMERLIMAIFVLVLVSMSALSGSEAQSTECVNSLMPCATFLKSGDPPATCCNLLREAVTKNKECLCSIFTNAALLHSLGATPADAARLPTRCTIAGSSTTFCSSSSSSSSPSPAPTSTNSPASTSSGKNGGDVVAWNAGISFGLALVTSFLFY